MTTSDAFLLVMGPVLALLAGAIAWMFRASNIHVAVRVAFIVGLIIVAGLSPMTINRVLGLPLYTTQSQLPHSFQLLGAWDTGADYIDVWIVTEDAQHPIALEVHNVDKKTRKAIEQGMKMIANGLPAMLSLGDDDTQEGQVTQGGTSGGSSSFPDDQHSFHIALPQGKTIK